MCGWVGGRESEKVETRETIHGVLLISWVGFMGLLGVDPIASVASYEVRQRFGPYREMKGGKSRRSEDVAFMTAATESNGKHFSH